MWLKSYFLFNFTLTAIALQMFLSIHLYFAGDRNKAALGAPRSTPKQVMLFISMQNWKTQGNLNNKKKAKKIRLSLFWNIRKNAEI